MSLNLQYSMAFAINLNNHWIRDSYGLMIASVTRILKLSPSLPYVINPNILLIFSDIIILLRLISFLWVFLNIRIYCMSLYTCIFYLLLFNSLYQIFYFF